MKYTAYLLLIPLSMLLGSCSSESEPNDWGFMQFTEVRAYRTNWDEKFAMGSITTADGGLNETRLPLEGVVLNDGQIEKLREAVTGDHPDPESADCIYPHHAFVFFDKAGEIVGAIDICFMCHNYWDYPTGYAKHYDLGAIYDLVEELGVPINNPAWAEDR